MAIKTLCKVYNSYYSRWVQLPMPIEYDGTVSTLVDSSRNAKGIIIGSVVLSGIGKVELSWNYLTKEVWSTILKLFEPSSSSLYTSSTGSFINYVKFYDQVSGGWTCRKMYVNDRSAGLVNLAPDGSVRGWKSPSIHLIDTGEDITSPSDTTLNNYKINYDGTLTLAGAIE